MFFKTENEAETEALGQRLGKTLSPGDVIALYGGLGAGKTAFVRGLARGLGYGGAVQSPTYSIANEYPSSPPLFHFDMYRLSSSAELYDIGWDDYLERRGVCAVEWSERIEDALPEIRIDVRISDAGDSCRSIELRGSALREGL